MGVSLLMPTGAPMTNSLARFTRFLKRHPVSTLLVLIGIGLLGESIVFAPRPQPGEPTLTKQQLWTCSMHPQVIRHEPGRCPICGMELVPLEPGTDEHAPSSQLSLSPEVVQMIGVRTAPVSHGRLQRSIRAAGMFVEAEPNVYDVTFRVGGWVEKLYATTDGMFIRAGEPLLELYSPELSRAVQELFVGREPSSGADASRGATERLRLLGLTPQQIEQLRSAGKAPRTITFLSPWSGHITQKTITTGAAVQAGERAFRIVDHSTLWIDADVYEQDLPFIKVGAEATATTTSAPGKTFAGRVSFVYPHVDTSTRTTRVRFEVSNGDLSLRPGMFAEATLRSEAAEESILLAREAVIDTGTRSIVFVALGSGRFEPREVTVGLESDTGVVQVLAGISREERVVSSGQLLLDSESRLREAIQKFGVPTEDPHSGAHQ